MVITINEPLVDLSGLSRRDLIRAVLELAAIYYSSGVSNVAVLADKCGRALPHGYKGGRGEL